MTSEQHQEQIMRLHRLTVWGRWLFVTASWLIIGSLSLWGLREEIELLRSHFTMAALRYTFNIEFNPWPTLGLGFCLGITSAVLVWQSCNILFGFSQQRRRDLERRLQRIHVVGSKHPLWHWIVREKSS